MRHAILFAVGLAVCGMIDNSVLAQEETPRYLVPYWRSVVGNEIRAVTALTVVNQSDRVCNVQVEWFRSNGTSVSTSGLASINPGEAFHFCSRSPTATVLTCSAGGVANPSLPTAGTNQGKAVVSSTEGHDCSLIAVDARVYYTTGSNSAGDTGISAVSNSKVVFIGEGNLGD